MQYVELTEFALFLSFAVPALVILHRADHPMDAMDGSVSIVFSVAIAIIILLTLLGWWAWTALA
jgi:hypothetical protein